MDYQKILMGVLAKTLNIGDGEISELLKDGENITESEVTKKILDLDKERVSKLKSGSDTEKFQEGYKKAKGEVLTEFEKKVKEAFGVESDKTGTDLITDIVSQKSEGKGGEGMTAEDIMKSEVYQNLLKKSKDDLKTIKDDYEQKISKIQSEQENERSLSIIGTEAVNQLASLNPILPKNAEIAKNYEGLFIKAIAENYRIKKEDGKTVVYGLDGKIAIDGHGNPIAFEDIVKTTAGRFYEFSANNGGSNAGNQEGAPPAGGGYPSGVKKPTNLDELSKILNDESIPLADRVTISETYNKEAKGIV